MHLERACVSVDSRFHPFFYLNKHFSWLGFCLNFFETRRYFGSPPPLLDHAPFWTWFPPWLWQGQGWIGLLSADSPTSESMQDSMAALRICNTRPPTRYMFRVTSWHNLVAALSVTGVQAERLVLIVLVHGGIQALSAASAWKFARVAHLKRAQRFRNAPLKHQES